MKVASITEAKNQLSALIDGLANGSPVLIVDRGRPVARLEPVAPLDDPEGTLSRLARQGLVRLPKAPMPKWLLNELPPGPQVSASVVDALLEERREGR